MNIVEKLRAGTDDELLAHDLMFAAAFEIERLRVVLRNIAILDDPQLGGIAKRGSLSKIALTALGEENPFEDRWDNA